MAFRFRRSIKVCKGLRINVSKSGLSASIGPRGASVNIGKRGTYMNTGIPGSGISFRQKLSDSQSSRRSFQAEQGSSKLSVTIEVNDDGDLLIHDGSGNPFPDKLTSMVKKNARSHILGLLSSSCAEFNEVSTNAIEIHFKTPFPEYYAHYEMKEFEEYKPLPPHMKQAGLLGMIMKSRVAKVEAENNAATEQYNFEVSEWEKRKEEFEQSEQDKKSKIEVRIFNDPEVMEEALEEALCNIDWPRETIVSFDIMNEGKRLFIDVDLPEIEDMPSKVATVQERNLRLGIKEMSEAQIRRQYMQHIHGIGFRLIGESFAALPTVEEVVISAFSQRPQAATGNTVDEYLYSLIVNRNEWSQLNFNKLSVIDPIEALARFNIKRNMTKTGVFKPIDPFTP